MTHYRPYLKYRESGIDWFGSLPEGWSTLAIKHLAVGRRTLFLDGDWIESKDLSDAGIRYLTTGNVGTGFFKEQGSGYITDEKFQELRCTEVFPRDLLIARLNKPIGRCCIVPNLGQRIVTAVDNVILRPAPGFNKRFLKYLFSSDGYFGHTELTARGTTMQRISRSQLGDIRIACPILESDQHVIADFLDRETARIDRLIDRKTRFIELLKEKRQALISHVVTKGLDPDVPMKDSGHPMVGVIPSHWKMQQLGWLTPPARQIMYGIVLPGPHIEGGVPIVKGGDVKSHRLRRNLLKCTTPEIESRYVRSRLQAGDLVYSIRGSIGDVAIVPPDVEGANLTQDAARIAPRSGVNNVWLMLALESSPIFRQLDAGAVGATIRGINIGDLKKAAIPTPPHEEQVNIADRLVQQTARLDKLMETTSASVDLLRERRSALITAAVTGKIDVRAEVSEGSEPIDSDTGSATLADKHRNPRAARN